MSDKELIDKLLQGDEKVLRSYYSLYKLKLSRFIDGRVSNYEDSEEILQDVFIQSLDALRNFTFKSSLTTFLYSIAGHKIIDFYRKKKIKQIVFSKLPEDITPLISKLLGPEEELYNKEVKQQIKQVLRRIKPVYSTIIKLKYIDGLSVKQIAKKTFMSAKSVESALFRARSSFVKEYRYLYRVDLRSYLKTDAR